jgi:hypothetical protein
MEQIVWIRSVQSCFPDREALLLLFTVCVLGRGESVPEDSREEHGLDAQESIGETVGEISVGEAIRRSEHVLID